MKRFVFSAMVCLLWQSFVTANEEVAVWVEQQLPRIVEFYQTLHAHPELSFEEEKTAARLAGEFSSMGMRVTTGVGGHGVVGMLENGSGPTLMVRTDMDALPVQEATGLVYASTVRAKNKNGVQVGVMHACGHDIHMANLVAVARFLATHTDLWSGTLMVIGQPAEERGAGAAAMLGDGLFQRFPKPDFALALHVDAHLAAGQVKYRAGYSLANVDSVDITVRGRGGHGAYPHATVDPIVQAAELILTLQNIVSREVKPIEPVVVTVGSIHGGTKHNVIGDSCHLQLTVRSYKDTVRKKVLEAIQRRAHGIAAAYNAPEPEIKVSEGTPSLWNDPELSGRLGPVFQRVLGEANVSEAEPSMGGEDFSRYGKAGVPILMFRLGSVDAQRLAGYQRVGGLAPSLHSPDYYPDAEETLKTGVLVMTHAVLELMPR